MSKTGDTKKRIIELLEHHSETLTSISEKLGLAPSTVSQHLQELVDGGEIKPIEDRPRKWKYYEVNRDYKYSNGQKWYYQKRVLAPLAIIILVAVLGFAFYSGRAPGKGNLATASLLDNSQVNAKQVYLAPNSTAPIGSTIFTVSDSPQLYNITALVVVVSNASIHSESTGKWYKLPLQQTSFDLVELKNISTILSGANLSYGDYNEVVFNISNVTAKVNGTIEKVYLPSGQLKIFGNFNISNSTVNWINFDFDLQHSIHISNDGRIVLLPVINVRHVYDNDLQLNQSYIIVAKGPGRVRAFFESGMDLNGTMNQNYSTPQNMGIIVNQQVGRNARISEAGSGSLPIVIRTNKGLIIGGNLNALINLSILTNSTLNVSGASNTTVAGVGCCYTVRIISEPQPEAMPCIPRLNSNESSNVTSNENSITGSSNTTVNVSSFRKRCCSGLAPGAGNPGSPQPEYIRVRRCFPITASSANTTVNSVIIRSSVAGAVNINSSGNAQGQVSAAWLNSGGHPNINVNNEGSLNISIQNGNSSTNSSCTLWNGAVSCSSSNQASAIGIAGIH
jgi:DNA-binding transcriptional ArsR family regulator